MYKNNQCHQHYDLMSNEKYFKTAIIFFMIDSQTLLQGDLQ